MSLAFSVLSRFYRQVFQAVTDFEFYRQVHRQPTPRTVLYLFLMLAHCGLLGTAYLSLFWLPNALEMTRWLLENAPPLRFEKGKLQVEGELPLLLRHPSPDGPSFVFARSIDDQLPSYQQPAFFLTEEGIYFFSESGPPLNWGMFVKDLASKTEVREWIDTWSFALLPFIVIVAFLPFAFLLPAEALIFSLFGYSAGARYSRRLPFRCHFTIAVYGLTPAVLIDLLGKALGLQDQLFRILYVITAGIYIFTATTRIMSGKQD